MILRRPEPYHPRATCCTIRGSAFWRAGDQQASRRHVVLNYGKGNHGHGHMDKLAVNLIAYGYDLSADLGYPPSWVAPKKAGWETHTASHCTAVIDGREPGVRNGQSESVRARAVGAHGRCRPASGPIRASRTCTEGRWRWFRWMRSGPTWSIGFRIAGGAEHDYSFHGWAGENAERFEIVLAEDAVLEAQDEGTLAGPGVPFGEAPGYGFVKDVARARTDGGLTATWRTEEDGAGIRLHMPGEAGIRR